VTGPPRGERTLDRVDVGGDLERWVELCDDAGREPGERGCAGWTELWPTSSAPPRKEVLDALARFDFRSILRLIW
jgi:hypothetical protein